MPKESAQKEEDIADKLNDESQKIVEELAQKTAIVKTEISTGVSLANNGIRSLESEANDVQKSIDSELTTFNITVDRFKKKASTARRDIVQSANNFVWSVNKTKENLEDYSLIVFAIALCILVAWEIGSWAISNSFSLDPAFFALIILVLGVTAAVNVTLRYTHKKFSAYEDKIIEDTKQVMDDTLNAFAEPLEFHTNTKGLKSKISSVVSDFNRTITAIGHFVPEYTTYYEFKNKVHRLGIFIQTLRNALGNFGIAIDENSEAELRGFFPHEKEYDEWISEISKRLSIKMCIPSELIELAYYEYTDNTEGKKNKWSSILDEPNLISNLIKLLCKEPIVDVSFLSGTEAAKSPSVQLIISQMPLFSIEEFRKTYYSFYNELADHKRLLLSSLTDFGIKVGDSEKKKIVSFVPIRERPFWIEELVGWSAQTVNAYKEIVSLIYFERIGYESKTNEIWAQIKAHSLDHFVQFLSKQPNFVLPKHYLENSSFEDFLKKMLLADVGAYSYTRISEKVLHNLSNLDNKKKIMLQAVENFSCSLSEEDRYEFQAYLPIEENPQDALFHSISEKIGGTSNIVRLFYYSYVQKELEEKALFKEIREQTSSEELLKLSELLFRKKKVQMPIGEKKAGIIEISEVLKIMTQRFDVIEAQLLLNKYIALGKYFSQLAEFSMSEHLICEDVDVTLNFADLIRISTVDSSEPEPDALLHLDAMFSYLLNNKSDWISNYKEHTTEIAAAVIALFLWRIRDNNREGACQRAADSEVSSKILYQYQILNENTIGRQTVRLLTVISGVLQNKLSGYECLTEFTLNLKHGLLVSGREELFTESIRQIKQKISGEIKEYKEALTELQSDVRDIFKTQLDSDITELFLNSNLISAYLITTNQRSQVITGIIDNTLVGCCKELAKDDTYYQDFLLLENESKSVGGYYTRTGLVPLGMSFKQFSSDFEKVFNKAKEEYKKKHPDPTKNYSINLLRILPSDIAFKAIMDTSSAKADTLIETVGSLIVDKLSVIDTFEFLTSLSGTEPKVELKSLVKTAIDHHTCIYSLINTDISDIGLSGRISELLKGKDFDKKLMAKYNCKTLSSLAIIIHKVNTDTGKAQEALYTNLIDIIQEKDDSDRSQIETLTKVFFRKLEKIGKVLSL
jgi:hypothetical protein